MFQVRLDNYVVAIEVDEFQHKRYDFEDEEKRILQIYEDADCKLVFIRFNPDSFKINKVKQNVPIEYRYEKLKRTIYEVFYMIEQEKYSEWLTEIKLYFDE